MERAGRRGTSTPMLSYSDTGPQMEELYIWAAVNHPKQPDIEGILDAADYWVTAATQKDAGQRGTRGTVNTMDGSFERVGAEPVYHGINLVTSGYIDQIDPDGPMEPLPVADKTGLKDGHRNRLEMKERFWGEPIDPAELRMAVREFLDSRRMDYYSDQLRSRLIAAVVTLALSGRLKGENNGST